MQYHRTNNGMNKKCLPKKELLFWSHTGGHWAIMLCKSQITLFLRRNVDTVKWEKGQENAPVIPSYEEEFVQHK